MYTYRKGTRSGVSDQRGNVLRHCDAYGNRNGHNNTKRDSNCNCDGIWNTNS